MSTKGLEIVALLLSTLTEAEDVSVVSEPGRSLCPLDSSTFEPVVTELENVFSCWILTCACRSSLSSSRALLLVFAACGAPGVGVEEERYEQWNFESVKST